MRRKILNAAIAVLTAICISVPSIGYSAEDNYISLFNSFSDYSETSDNGRLPNGVTVLKDYRKEKLSAYCDGAARYGNALKIGYRAEPIIPFGKLINSNKMHISFDIKATDVDLRNIYIGFYNGRNNSAPNDFGEKDYSMTIVMERGKIMYMKVDENEKRANDILAWNKIESGITYEPNKWYSIDYVFDFEKQELNYYVDGRLLNKTSVGTAAANGLKSIFFRCEVPKDSGYEKRDAAFIIDNISIDEYSDSYEIGNIKESTVSTDSPYVYVNCADIIDTPTEEDISIKDESGNSVDFRIAESDSRGFLIDVSNPKPKKSYALDMSRIRGTKFGSSGRSSIVFNFSGDESCCFSDTFDSYDNDTFLEKWSPSVEGGAELGGGTDRNRYARIFSADSDSETESSVSRVFGESITADAFTVETAVKATGEFDVAFIDVDGNKTNIFGVQIDGQIGCCTETEGRPEVRSDLRLANLNEFEKIKLLVDKTNKKFTVTTGSKSYDFDYKYQLGDIYGISITAKNASAREIWVDDVYIKKVGATGVYAEFGGDKTYCGAMFYSDGKRTAEGQVLRCAEKTDSSNDTEYYSIDKQNGTMVIKTDADSGIECDGIKNIRLEIEYIDSGYGWFYAEYETPNGTGTTAAACMTDSGEIKKTTFIIDDWTKSVMSVVKIKDEKEKDREEKLYAACLTLKTYTTVSDGKQPANNRNYSKYPVVIKSIRLTDTDTSAYVKASAETEKTGNIFFEDETPKFNILLNNETEDAKNVRCTARVYEKYKNGIESQIYSTVFNADIGGKGTKNIKIAVPIDRFGLYSLKTEISGGGVWNAAETEFLKCASVSTQNYTIGAAAHFTQYGDTESGAELLKKAGMGLVRDDFLWREYEKKIGDYALTERQQRLCRAAVDYNLKLLPIVYGNNKLYDSTGSDFVSDGAMPNYLEFVRRILSEPEMRAACDMVELWNEPDIKKTRDGAFIASSEARGEIYGKILRESAIAVKEVNNKTGSHYKIGAFSLSNLASENGRRFMDKTLEQLKNGNYFDAITMHPYMLPTVDPERGKQGEDTTNPFDYVGYRINYINALVNGGEVYNDVTGEYDAPVGTVTGEKYHFKPPEPLWHTEQGVSSAKYDSDPLCVGDQYSQAIWIIRGLNQIKLNNITDKVWIYDFADDGDRMNEREMNFGIVRSHTNSVPYAAKYAYLALAAFNKLTEGATAAREYYSDDYKYIAKYSSNGRDSYLLWTTKPTEQTIEYDFGKNVRFYDLLGNEISENSVMRDGKYILTGEPYWAVTGDAPKYCISDKNKSGLYVVKDEIGTDNAKIPTNGKTFDILADLSGTNGGERVMIAVAYKDDMLKEIKLYKVKENVSFQIFNDIGFDESDINRIKIMLYEGMSGIKPLCVPLEN